MIPGCLDDIVGCHDFTPKDGQPVKFMVSRGDYSKLMLMITKNLGKAKVRFKKTAVQTYNLRKNSTN